MLTTRVTFHCRQCHATLSDPLRKAQEAELTFVVPNKGYFAHFLPKDAYHISNGRGKVVRTFSGGGRDVRGFVKGVFVVNLYAGQGKEVEWDRNQGCCGPTADINDMNFMCINDHKIGGLQRECCLPNGIAFDPNSVYLSDSDDLELPLDAASELRSFAKKYSTVLALTHGIAASSSLDGLYALADALEESGYTNTRILEHLRDELTHHEGCIVLDWLLGSEP